jgi:hypothetical protein
VNIAKASAEGPREEAPEEQVEQDELEGGEINLIPYLGHRHQPDAVHPGVDLQWTDPRQLNTTLPDPSRRRPRRRRAFRRRRSAWLTRRQIAPTSSGVFSTNPAFQQVVASCRRCASSGVPQARIRPGAEYRALNDFSTGCPRWSNAAAFATYRVVPVIRHLYGTLIAVRIPCAQLPLTARSRGPACCRAIGRAPTAIREMDPTTRKPVQIARRQEADRALQP